MGFDFEGLRFENAFVLDLLTDGKVVVEIKSVERLAPVFAKQLQNVSAAHRLPGRTTDRLQRNASQNGIERVVNRLPETSQRAPLPRVLRVK
jgi:hypothetical protein